MKDRIKVTTFLIVLLLYIPNVIADQREITFPEDIDILNTHPGALSFVHSGQIGIINAFSSKNLSSHLFSFSVAEGKVIDEVNLSADFGTVSSDSSPITFMRVHSKTGVIIVYGHDPNGVQKVLAVASDGAGRFRKLWIISYSQVDGLWPEVAFNEDGSKLYVVYTELVSGAPSQRPDLLHKRDLAVLIVQTLSRARLLFTMQPPISNSAPVIPRQRVALIRVKDGMTLATASLPDISPFGGILFDKTHKRAIALTEQSVYVLTSRGNSLEVESRIVAPEPSFNIGLGVSRNGRYVVAYSGYDLFNRNNTFYSYDLELKTARELSIKEEYFPESNLMTFYRRTNTLFVPLSGVINIADSNTADPLVGSRRANIITIATDGVLLQAANVELPEHSPGARGPNAITGFNNIEISASGALGFVSSHNGRLFAFDTLTGEIVNDEPMDFNGLRYIQLLKSHNLLIADNARNKLVITDVSTGPVITSVLVKGNRTIIKGKNFLAGARVQINGEDLGIANRALSKPGRRITIPRGENDFPQGQEFSVVVVNRDGLSSQPFTFKR